MILATVVDSLRTRGKRWCSAVCSNDSASVAANRSGGCSSGPRSSPRTSSSRRSRSSARPRRQLGRIVVERKFASEYDVLQAIAKYYRVSATSLSDDFAALLEPRTTSWREKLAHLRIPIRIKLSIAITFMIWLTILTLSVVMLARQRDRLYAQTMRTGTVSLNYFANDAALPLLEDDTLRLNGLIKESASVEGLVYASIVDRAGVIRAHTDTTRIGAAAAALPRAGGSPAPRGRSPRDLPGRRRGAPDEHLARR